MSGIKELMENAASDDQYVAAGAWMALRDRMELAAPLVLEYMKHEHHRYCAVVQQELWSKTWQLKQTIKRECTCGYDALARALGVGE